MNNIKFLLGPTLIIMIAALMRVLPHLPNATPIAAMAIFSGAYLNKKYAFIIPITAMFISDLFIGFHSTMFYVYLSFIIITLIGLWLGKHRSAKNLITSVLFSSILFFIITNFGVWLEGWYPRTLSGLMQSYFMGIPFFKNTLLGDALYTGLFFGSFELAKSLLTKTAISKG